MASHRLIQHLGKTYGLAVSEAVYDKLNQYYFVDGHSLNDRPMLAKVVAELLKELLPNRAPNEAELLEFLDSEKGKEEITNIGHALNQLGISGIPKFIIEGRTMVRQDPTPLSRSFERLRDGEKSTAVPFSTMFWE
eukprot:CAMPEP_0116098066 /NCGR_PEP_ID=MMETSP0327-20121206/11028_1 /TAXON_ID=44447 /ORGANISM="Pseudo-nitzschia delicatissima, Strain B596" /LENGTH=135 /DNA_ID=CAMNT_0003589835 /DNA_START=127 /DNA_END=534 /DNA_ORIENTATION=-